MIRKRYAVSDGETRGRGIAREKKNSRISRKGRGAGEMSKRISSKTGKRGEKHKEGGTTKEAPKEEKAPGILTKKYEGGKKNAYCDPAERGGVKKKTKKKKEKRAGPGTGKGGAGGKGDYWEGGNRRGRVHHHKRLNVREKTAQY